MEKSSIYLGKIYTSKEPLLYYKNLPHIENVSRHISRSGSVLISKEASRTIEDFHQECCMRPHGLVSPIRVEYIPPETKFKVVGEYLYYRQKLLFESTFDSKIHMLLLADANGIISEISQRAFENRFTSDSIARRPRGREENWAFKQLDRFKGADKVSFHFCHYDRKEQRPEDAPKVSTLIKDFQIEDKVTVEEGNFTCKHERDLWKKKGDTITFSNQESFLTVFVFFERWYLLGQWKE